jgi:RNA polymerase sigma-70 factor (ECF subfamily)
MPNKWRSFDTNMESNSAFTSIHRFERLECRVQPAQRMSGFRDQREEDAMAPQLITFEDSALIKLALAGQTECFTVLTDRHLPTVRRRIAAMVPNTTDADDVLQEALLKVWRYLSTFRAQSSFCTWMTRVAINEALQSYRREQRRPVCQALGDFDTFASANESPLQSLARAEATQAVRQAIVELPAKYREVLVLRELEQLSERETAQSLQSSIPAVKTRLFRARLMLRTALQRSKIQGWTRIGAVGRVVSPRRAGKRHNAAAGATKDAGAKGSGTES